MTGTIPCWCYLVLLRLVSTFLHVGPVQITRGLLPTRFFALYAVCNILYAYYIIFIIIMLSKKVKFQVRFLGK